MATTTGVVRRFAVFPSTTASAIASMACAWIGPNTTRPELLTVVREKEESPEVRDLKISMIEALRSAHIHSLEVTATHGDSDARITWLIVEELSP